jgi:hypothetical protein
MSAWPWRRPGERVGHMFSLPNLEMLAVRRPSNLDTRANGSEGGLASRARLAFKPGCPLCSAPPPVGRPTSTWLRNGSRPTVRRRNISG